ERARRRGRPERAHQHEPLHPRGFRGGEEVARSLRHHPVEVLWAPPDDRDEVHDVRATVDRGREARGIRRVSSDELRAEPRELCAALGPADERADVAPVRAQRVDDPWANEAGAAGDEDLHAWKFCQYRDGVGPRWPW